MSQILTRFVLLFSLIFSGSVSAQQDLQTFKISADTPIISSPAQSTVVLKDPAGDITVQQALNRVNEFVPADQMEPLDAHSQYWIMQRISSELTEDRTYRLQGPWLSIFAYLIRQDGKVTELRPTGYGYGYSPLSDIDPAKAGSSNIPSGAALFTLHAGETVTLISHTKSLPAFTRNYVLRIVDHAKFLEARRFGLYVEGALLGILFALGVFGWYSHLLNKDRTSLLYGIWITFAFFQVFNIYSHDGFHFSEFIVNVDGIGFGEQYLSNILYGFPAYGQLVFFFLFASAFLQFARYFPLAQKIIYACAFFFVLFFLHGVVARTKIPANIYYLPNAILPLMICIIIFRCGMLRYRAGMKIAMFFMIGCIPYFVFRLIFVMGLLGLPSIFSYLPESGVSYLLQNNFVSQAIGLCGEAIIMALAVVNRNKWIQQELIQTQETQKELIASQNQVLELTVSERTKELQEKHNALDEAHRNVVSSVNYASRLQRGQLPRPIRIDGRFASFATWWEPRDTIGGDLFWISSSQYDGPYILSVADCTGHGVPGAMLSLLVSNSLERIYAGDASEDPASALKSLDHYVRTGLNQDRLDAESDDGCDAAILRIDRQLQRIEFAGAKIDLFHANREGHVRRYRANRVSLGYKQPFKDTEAPELVVIPYAEGDLFAVVTDGLTDQLGGPEGAPEKSFGYRRLEQVLATHHTSTANVVLEELQLSFKAWQGRRPRRDDMTAVIFKL